MNKNTIPENFTMGLALFDAIPVVLFGISMVLLGTILASPLFVISSVLCFWAGISKLIWKLIVVKKKKNIWWLFMQMRIVMPVGFVLMILSFILSKSNEGFEYLVQSAFEMPVLAFLVVGIMGMILMGVFASKLDSSNAKSNWIEEITNAASQFVILLGIVLLFYGSSYYKAEDVALKALSPTNSVDVEVTDDYIFFEPKGNDSDTALILYPGAKVEFSAYAPLAKKLAENNICCVLVRMPINLAFFGQNKAEAIVSKYKGIETWYIGGHSLGGVAASCYAKENKDRIEGVVLLASYSTKDLSGLKVLSIYGDKDGVLNISQYEKNKINLPDDLMEVIIKGGNHAQFADYGFQEKDNKASITTSEQISITADAIVDMMTNK